MHHLLQLPVGLGLAGFALCFLRTPLGAPDDAIAKGVAAAVMLVALTIAMARHGDRRRR